MDATRCRCTHPRSAHEHFRPGSECSLCGAAGCARFRPSRSMTTVFAGMRARLAARHTPGDAPGAVLRMPTPEQVRAERGDETGGSAASGA